MYLHCGSGLPCTCVESGRCVACGVYRSACSVVCVLRMYMLWVGCVCSMFVSFYVLMRVCVFVWHCSVDFLCVCIM